jgi:hypothetical protein
MKVEKPKITIEGIEYDIYSMEEFKTLIGNPNISTPTIAYNIEKDKLDFTPIGHARYIIYNEKAKKFAMKFKDAKKTKRSAMTLSA